MALSGDTQVCETRKNKDPLASHEADTVSSAAGVGRLSHITKHCYISKNNLFWPWRSRRVAEARSSRQAANVLFAGELQLQVALSGFCAILPTP